MSSFVLQERRAMSRRELVDREKGDPIFQHMRVSAWAHITNVAKGLRVRVGRIASEAT